MKEAKATRAERWGMSVNAMSPQETTGWEQKYSYYFENDSSKLRTGTWNDYYENHAGEIFYNNFYNVLDRIAHRPNPIFQIEKPIEPLHPELLVLAVLDGVRLGYATFRYGPTLARMSYDILKEGNLLRDVGSFAGSALREGKGLALNAATAVGRGASELGSEIKHGFGSLASKLGVFGRSGGERAVGLTTRLNRTQIKEYLANVHNISRDQLINDIQSLGLKLRGQSRDGLFKTFEDKLERIKVKLHPPDTTTDYSHMHINDSRGNPLTIDLEIGLKYSPDVHIGIQPIKEELEWRPKR